MDFEDLKIVSSDYTGQDVASLPDVVSGQATALKARFDNLVKNLVATRFNSLIDGIKEQVVPSGVVKAFAGSTAPDGWLLCNGQAVSRSEFAALFAVIGTTYGAGDKSTTFNVPNLQGKMIIGADSTYTLGKTGGSATAHAQIHVNGGEQINFKRKAGRFTSNIALGGTGGSIGGVEKSCTYVVNVVGDDDTTCALPPYIAMNYIIKI